MKKNAKKTETQTKKIEAKKVGRWAFPLRPARTGIGRRPSEHYEVMCSEYTSKMLRVADRRYNLHLAMKFWPQGGANVRDHEEQEA